ncbi:MAG: UDP-N-acetylmuramate dehydrogenase [Prevotella sp.]|nr:UDP-N-acetylmuramate dehydrogenase [Prevotella sp.]
MKIYNDYSLAAHNTFGIDERCKRFIDIECEQDAIDVCSMIDPDERLLIVGQGSNLLLGGFFDGTVLHSAITGCHSVAIGNEVMLRCGSGECWDDVVAFAVDNGWFGMENMSLIPGDVGASAVQNIGAYGAEAKDVISQIEAVELATGKKVTINNHECDYGYRNSRFKGEWKNRFFITHVTYQLSVEYAPRLDYGNIRAELMHRNIDYPLPLQLRQVIIDIRNAKLPDPKVLGNAGSFFMNPVVERPVFEALQSRYPDMPYYEIDDDHVKIPAGWMIEQCGWKGRDLGNAGVYDKQALVLVNRGGATGKDVINLAHAVINDVKEKFGIEIHPEVNVVC